MTTVTSHQTYTAAAIERIIGPQPSQRETIEALIEDGAFGRVVTPDDGTTRLAVRDDVAAALGYRPDDLPPGDGPTVLLPAADPTPVNARATIPTPQGVYTPPATQSLSAAGTIPPSQRRLGLHVTKGMPPPPPPDPDWRTPSRHGRRL